MMTQSLLHLFTDKLRLGKPWKYKLPLLMGLVYFFIIVGDLTSEVAFFSVLAAIVTAIGFAAFGYLMNDISDKTADFEAGKKNVIGSLSKLQISMLILVFLTLAIGPWFYLPVDSVSLLLIVAELFLFVVYAFPPFRLKEKGMLGLIADASYAHVIPGILASWTFHLVGGKHYDYIVEFICVLGIWQLVSGLRNILSHQILDYESDLRSGTETYVAKRGTKGLEQLMLSRVIPLESTLFIVFILFIQMELSYVIVVVFIYWVYAVYKSSKDRGHINGLVSKYKTNVLDKFYVKILPIIILIGGIFIEMEVRNIILVHFILFTPYPRMGLLKARDTVVNVFN